jgi:hypothetical protein
MDKNRPIRYTSELAHEFRSLLDADPDLKWQPAAAPIATRLHAVELPWDGSLLQFIPHYHVTPTPADLDALTSPTTETDLPPDKKSPLPLLVTPRLNSHLLGLCRARHLSAVDLNGRAYLRARGLWIDRPALPGRHFRFEAEPRNIFTGKSVRTVRSLLAHSKKTWTQSELIQRTQASSGLVSRIVTHLLRLGLLEKSSSRSFRVQNAAALLDAWVEADRFSARTTTRQYTVLTGSGLDHAHTVQKLFVGENQQPVFTQWIAGWLRHPFAEPVIVSAYVPTWPDENALTQAGLRAVDEGGRVWLHLPADEGVFLETQTVKNVPLVSDAQIFLDLQDAPLRGVEQAHALREWPGFGEQEWNTLTHP